MTKRFYDRRLNDASRQLEEFKSKSSKLAFLRLLSFSVVLLCLILFFFDKKLFYLIASFTFFVGFIVLVINHDKVIKKIQYYRFLIETLYEYIYRFDDGRVLKKPVLNSQTMSYHFYMILILLGTRHSFSI